MMVMKELFYVIKREYYTRVRSKAFILITILTPLFFSLIFVLPVYFATQHEDYKNTTIGLIDSSPLLQNAFNELELKVENIDVSAMEDIHSVIQLNQLEGVVYWDHSDSLNMHVKYYSDKQPSVFLLNQIRRAIQNVVLNDQMNDLGIDNINSIINSIKKKIVVENIKVSEGSLQTTGNPYQRPLCLILGLVIYLTIFLFSSQVMRGVLEEKSNRIVELVITSISPVKFMSGKIIGIALLGITQMICWIIVILGLIQILSFLPGATSTGFISQKIAPEDIEQIITNLSLIDFGTIVPLFLFYFLGGYLLYSSMFAALAATANHNDDIQQVTMIVTLPLTLSVVILSNTVNSPDSVLSYWCSIIPFTSPVIMMGRVVYGVATQDIILSMFILLCTLIFTVWLSGKIYKNTILYNGKKMKLYQLLIVIKNNIINRK